MPRKIFLKITQDGNSTYPVYPIKVRGKIHNYKMQQGIRQRALPCIHNHTFAIDMQIE